MAGADDWDDYAKGKWGEKPAWFVLGVKLAARLWCTGKSCAHMSCVVLVELDHLPTDVYISDYGKKGWKAPHTILGASFLWK